VTLISTFDLPAQFAEGVLVESQSLEAFSKA
jgi:hypothetical protein